MFITRLVEGNEYMPSFFCFEFLSSGANISQISPADEGYFGRCQKRQLTSPEGALSEEACTGLWIATADHTVTHRQPAASYTVLNGAEWCVAGLLRHRQSLCWAWLLRWGARSEDCRIGASV